MATQQDKYSNIATLAVTMSAANTLTSQEMVTGISLGQGVGLLIDHIDYYPNSIMVGEMTATGDYIWWSVSTQAEKYLVTEPQVIDSGLLTQHDFGAGALRAHALQWPIERYFSPPLIIATPRLYLNLVTNGLANPGNITCKIYYRYVKLTTQEYLELAEAYVLVS